MKARLLISSALILMLAGCQTTQSNLKPDHTPIVEEQIQEQVWVDLTPYPKSNSSNSDSTTPVNTGYENHSAGRIGSWSVRFSDGTIRQALARWADEAGWSFNNSHYDLSVDIPITAEATLVQQGTFKQAVQALVEAVALSEHPMRACFYQNDVLRIIGYNGSCNSRSN